MDPSSLLVASAIAVALILVQVALVTLRNAVRGRLFPAAPDALRPVATDAPTPFASALPQSTRQARQSGDPSIEE